MLSRYNDTYYICLRYCGTFCNDDQDVVCCSRSFSASCYTCDVTHLARSRNNSFLLVWLRFTLLQLVVFPERAVFLRKWPSIHADRRHLSVYEIVHVLSTFHSPWLFVFMNCLHYQSVCVKHCTLIQSFPVRTTVDVHRDYWSV